MFSWGCKPKLSDSEIQSRVDAIIADLPKQQNLDERETVYQISGTVAKRVVTLSGQVSDGALLDAVVSAIKAIPGAIVQNNVEILPSKKLADKIWAIVNQPVINLGDAPGQATGSHTVTQAKLGEILELLEEKDGWFRVRTEDNYLGWADPTGFVSMTKEARDELLSGKVALIKDKMTPAYDSSSGQNEVFERKVVQGTVLPLQGYTEQRAVLKLADGRLIYVAKTAVTEFPSRDQVFKEKKGADAIIATAEQYLGLPYLWGGTTAYGFDCSGFTQFCFKMNGYFLPRDADMQYAQGVPVDRNNLQPGDLVFFQTYKQGPSHVGIYIGNSKFIHAGSSSGVTINSFNRADKDYSATLDQEYLGARRIISQETGK